MQAYTEFAALYDTLMDDFDYGAWAEYYQKLIARLGVEPKSLCDCACGTGSLTVEFAKIIPRVTGTDLAEKMLAIAQEKARHKGVKAMFVREDMTKLNLPRPVDAIVCGCDGVNYLASLESVKAFFERVHASVRPGGAFAFDISSPYKLEQVLSNNFFGEERDEIAYLWQNQWDAASRLVYMNLTFFVRETDGRYRRFAETHTQRAHTPQEIIPLLEASGFSQIQIYGDQTFAAPKEKEMRIHFAARRD